MSLASFQPHFVPPDPPQNVCTAAQIAMIATCLSTNSAACKSFVDPDAGNKTCIDCMVSASGAASYGPVVIDPTNNVDTLNVGGCITLVDPVRGSVRLRRHRHPAVPLRGVRELPADHVPRPSGVRRLHQRLGHLLMPARVQREPGLHDASEDEGGSELLPRAGVQQRRAVLRQGLLRQRPIGWTGVARVGIDGRVELQIHAKVALRRATPGPGSARGSPARADASWGRRPRTRARPRGPACRGRRGGCA